MSLRAVSNVALLALAFALLSLVGLVVVGICLFNQIRVQSGEIVKALNGVSTALNKQVPKDFKDARRDK